MIVCSCNVFSDGQVRACLHPGPGCPRTPAQVYACLGCSPKCGRCARTIRGILSRALAEVHATCATACSAACPLSAEPRAAPAEAA
ncbi:(2Fe-2S)-binding protein [Methylobacterium nodulans]|uniref:Bacterioferritin-associated ferredoxin n=1 Tax=Methylobacterium nodulans (strain LMG 21967 / CNCM I-2342 / ORS 2060) TaxID=460265 RepID=B8INI5_METNO|nr:(2Fe-2S)-binding protein [Methylobacterium nodulans]ACL56511.1 BFD domain protein (2Fe-2S)-binding domain protein [Methylobacterium nodulans ORS 2060]ACL60952.1 BFD domain protein (2Fe-2S)-binding domain protein [Methylobacterium nodulans ORS 2060]